jgi:hypothetical protein
LGNIRKFRQLKFFINALILGGLDRNGKQRLSGLQEIRQKYGLFPARRPIVALFRNIEQVTKKISHEFRP